MSTVDVWKVALAFVASLGGGGIIVLGLASWLGKLWSERFLEKEKLRYTKELEVIRREQEEQLQKLRANLETATFEHQTRFSWYHQRKADLVAEIYRLMNDTNEYVKQMVSPIQFGDDASRAAQIAETLSLYNQLAREFYGKRIFLDREICEKVDAVLKTTKTAISNWQISQEEGFKRTKDALLLWQEAHKSMEENVPPLLQELETRFRATLSSIAPST